MPELVGVQASLEPGGPAGSEDRPRLVDVEGPALAEHVDPPGVRGGPSEHRPGHEVDVPGDVIGVLGRDNVRAKEGDLLGERASHRQ